MELRVEPREGLADEVPTVQILGTPAGDPVRLTVETVDAAGHRWRSSTVAGEEDPTRPWWAMEFDSEDVAPVDFTASPDRLEFRLRAETGGESAEATAVRVWRSGPPPQTVDGDGFRLTVFAPLGGAAKRSVLMIPGSMGSSSMLPRAGLFASHGHGVGLLSYVGEEGLPPALCEVPLESLAAGYRAFAERPECEGEIVVYTGSVGTGGALAALAAFPDLDPAGVVALAPTHVIWQALSESGPPPKASSWTLAGEPLDWVPMHGERILPEMVRHSVSRHFHRRPRPEALHLRTAYAAGLKDAAAVDAARIEVEKIRCPLLLFAGKDDQMWPGAEMAREIVSRRDRPDDRLLTFEDVGHFIGAPLVPTTAPWTESLAAGGTAAGIARAQAESWQMILAFLGLPSG
jgi:pimeloyl-ACP methyl ester carboxylesterase